MSTVVETVPVLLGCRCPVCGETYLRRPQLVGHHHAMHHAGVLAHEINRATVDVPRRCAFGADLGALGLP